MAHTQNMFIYNPKGYGYEPGVTLFHVTLHSTACQLWATHVHHMCIDPWSHTLLQASGIHSDV